MTFATMIKFMSVSLAMFSFTHCKDPAPSKRSVSSSADGAVNCLTGKTALTSSSWQSGISTIFVNNCGSCHPGTQPSNYTLYANVQANIANIVTKIQSGEMPKNKTLSQPDKEALSAWVMAGYPETDGAVTPSGATPTPNLDPNTGSTTPSTTNCIPEAIPISTASPSPTVSGNAVETPALTPTPTI